MKEQLIEKARKMGFVSEILWNKPYKYSNREDLRYALWMEELRRWLDKEHDIIINIIHWGIKVRSISSKPKYECNIYSDELRIKSAFGESHEEALESGLLCYFEIDN